MKALIACVVLLAVGCTLDDERPDRSCARSEDCFRAQGEVCNPQTKRCEVAPDAGPADARPADAGPPDAGPPDAGPPDASKATSALADDREEIADE